MSATDGTIKILPQKVQVDHDACLATGRATVASESRVSTLDVVNTTMAHTFEKQNSFKLLMSGTFTGGVQLLVLSQTCLKSEAFYFAARSK